MYTIRASKIRAKAFPQTALHSVVRGIRDAGNLSDRGIHVTSTDALREKTFCVERVIAQKFPQRAVVCVRPSTRNDIRSRAGAVAELRISRVRQNAKFRDGIHGGFNTNPPSTLLKLSAPSIRKLLDSGLCPFTAYAWPSRNDPPACCRPGVIAATPGCSN